MSTTTTPLHDGLGCAMETNANPTFTPQALIFDCDGTVLDTMEWYYPSWETVCNKYNIDFSRKKFYSLAGVPVANIFATILEEQNITHVSITTLMEEKHAIVEEQRHTSVPGRIECVCDIVRANHGRLKMAIASSGHKQNVLEGLKENDMFKYFDAVVTHEDVPEGKNKPAPDIFLLAAKQLGVDPTLCRGFEDADVGMASLRAAGMDACDVRKMKDYPHKFD